MKISVVGLSGCGKTSIYSTTLGGMTPMEVIIAGTRHAAHVCNLENELGTIEPGKIADLIAVNGNPLDDLESLLKIEMVIHNGEIIKDKTMH